MPDFTDNLKPAAPHGSDILATERSQSDVPVDELSRHLLCRNDFLHRQDRVLKVLEKDPLFNKSRQLNLSRPERYQLGLARAKKLRRLQDQHNWDAEDVNMSQYLCDDVSPYMVHYAMFITTIREQGDEQQRAYWLPKAEKMEAIGCYAQTELGHGSNVKKLECEARWDPKAKEFVLHSPTLTASKWWNGTMGRTANHAIVVAQLMVPKDAQSSEYVNHGPHPFIVQIRELKTHRPLPGIAVGDIGPKYGYAPMDNGYMLFDHFRIPHSAMLSNYSRVDRNTCTYSRPANPAVVYGSLTYVRASIIMHARLIIARAVTIAVRYTSIRRQFQDRDSTAQNAPEMAVLDYPTVQIRILPLLATSFALHYTGAAMQDLYQDTRAQIDQGDFSRLTVLHAQSSGLKSLCTELAANSIETCRRAMGGHGFGGASGYIQLNNDYLSKPTVEGDNWMITQQTASYLIKRMAAAVSGKGDAQDEVEQACRVWLSEKDGSAPLPIYDRDECVVQAFQRRSRYLSYHAFVDREVNKKSWNSLLIQLRKVSHAESQAILVVNFYNALHDSQSELSPTSTRHLQSLFRLFAFYTMDADAREFLKAGAVSDRDLDRLPDSIQSLMADIRPHAVALVDAWRVPDFLLDSALGRYDGKVYEDLFDRAHRRNPLNDITFNPYYQSDEIVMGQGSEELGKILAKL
ncbi:Peroxisomal acyl-coenzyme A oxidase 1 [Teratosphaeria destructans]|uniref:Acyl-coenzyme A oxidase n=1 Tax=Teratosphaeria destructans TaxID=418781 RepID=A0A9W7W1X9_9PEZI|nr:Peroxisomal acyl-coenzyme A oxidase 1 [Teratosphaeria destructans]